MLLTDIATFLAAGGYGVYDPTGATSTIFVADIPDAPDAVICLEEYVGISAPAAWTLDGATLPRFETPNLHVTVRGAPNDYLGPRAIIENIYRLFLSTTDFYIGSTPYNRITPLGSGIFPMPKNSDARLRRLITCNFAVMKGFG